MSFGMQADGSPPVLHDEASRPHCLRAILRMSDLRPTRQRLQIAQCLIGRERHFTAEHLHQEVTGSGVEMSLATVYNTLRQFQRVGIVRELPIDGMAGIFDTDTSSHHHFYIIEDNNILDIPVGALALTDLPPIPAGYKVGRVEVIVRLQRT